MPTVEEHIEFEDVDPEAAGRVAKRVNLSGIRLVWINALLNVDPEELVSDWASKTAIGFDTHALEIAEDGQSFNASATFFAGYKKEWVEGDKTEYDPDDPPDLDLGVMFELRYQIRDGDPLDPSDIEHFAVLNATFNAWPYWREVAQTTTQKMGIQPLLVPVFVFPGIAVRTAEPTP